MASERVVTGTATVVFVLLSVVLWGDYLNHSSQIYGERDAAQAQINAIDNEVATSPDADLVQLSIDRAGAQGLYDQAEKKINDMDGWNSAQWKVKNSLRLAAPAVAVLFAAFWLLSILHPLK
jgi:hypothetical protein